MEIAKRQKKRVEPEYHEKIDQLLDTYARKLAENMNKGYEITARVPSVLIAGPANFPVRAKEKQNAASDRNMEEFQYIQGLLDKIRSTGMGGISADDPQAVSKLEKKLEKLEAFQELMKAVNAYYRKHGTLDGCPHLTEKGIENLKADMASSWHYEKKPFQSWQLSNNNAEIRRLKGRIEELTRHKEAAYVGWEFDGGTVEINREANRLQIFFEGKPDAAVRDELKSNGFRWSPKAEAWQRQLNDTTIRVTDRIKCIQPLSGEKPSALQLAARREKEKPSIRAQLQASKAEQGQKPPAREKSKGLEVELTVTQGGTIRGNLYELDYQQHFRHVVEASQPVSVNRLFYEHGTRDIPDGQYFDGIPDRVLGNFLRYEAQPHDSRIETEARRIVDKLKDLSAPNSPNKTHFMVEISPHFDALASTKDNDRLFAMLPYKSLCFTSIKDRHGVYAMINKDERRDVSIRKPRPSIRKQLADSKQATSPKKAAARTKKNELEV